MSKLHIARRPKRMGLYIPMKGNRDNPSLVFPLYEIDPSELDELIRAILEKQGVTEESEVQAVIDQAEQDSEVRIKISESRAEVRRLMALKRKGAKLMQRGFRRWVEVFYSPLKEFKKDA
jgi:hypothetical protein